MGVHSFTGAQVPDGMEKPEGNIGHPPFELKVQSLNKQHGIFGGNYITYVREMHLLDKFYTRHADLVDSTAAARLNGYAGQNGTKAQLSRELQSLGVSEEGKKVLKKLVGK